MSGSSSQLNRIFESFNKGQTHHKFTRIPVLIFSNWLFQGIFYMDRFEKTIRVLLEFIWVALLSLMLFQFLGILTSILFSIIIVHTIDWILNCQFFALFKKFGWVHTSFEKFNFFNSALEKLGSRNKGIESILLCGSISRGSQTNESDLDVRVIRRGGLINGIRAYAFCVWARFMAFIKAFPLDLYLFDEIESLKKVRSTERLITLWKRKE